jgi:plastocyanin
MRLRFTEVIVVIVVIIAALVAAGCGGSASAPKGAGGTVVVNEGDIFLDKPEYTVENGLITILVTNAGKVHHDLRVRNQPLFLETKPGQTASGTVTLPKGTYDLFCSITGHANASAKLVVS